MSYLFALLQKFASKFESPRICRWTATTRIKHVSRNPSVNAKRAAPLSASVCNARLTAARESQFEQHATAIVVRPARQLHRFM